MLGGCESFTIADCEGLDGIRESVVVCADDEEGAAPTSRLLVLLPGDVHNHRMLMRGMSGENAFASYSFEDIAARLRDRCLAGTAVLVVCPPRHSGSLSLWEHFLSGGRTAAHLQRITETAVARAAATHRLRLAAAPAEPGKLPVVLAGFSKGSLVVNGVVSDIATLSTLHSSSAPQRLATVLDWEAEDKGGAWSLPPYEPSLRITREGASAARVAEHAADIRALLDRLVAVHWVDAHRFPTNPAVVAAFARELGARGASIALHGTPRQLQDRSRRWIAAEHDRFLALLQQQHGCVKFSDTRLFWDKPPSLEAHFAALDAFDTGLGVSQSQQQ